MRNLLITILTLFSLVAIAQETRLLSLQESIEIAIENNLNVQRSELNLLSSEVDLMQSKAQRYPTLNASGNYGYNWGRGIDPTTNQFIDQRINFNSVGASTRMPLIQGLQVTNAIKQDRLSVEASRYDLKKTINDISLSTAQTYLNVIFNKELVENAEFQLESGRQQLDRTTILVESGALPLANKLQLESQVATNEVNLINAQNNLDLALLDLKQALLLPPGEEIGIVVPEIEIDGTEIQNQSITEIYQTALANQPEIKSAELNVQSADVGVDVARGGFYPSLTLSGSVDTRYSDASQDFIPTGDPITDIQPTNLRTVSGEPVELVTQTQEGDFETTSLGTQYDNNFSRNLSLSLNIPIFNGYSTRANFQRTKIALQQAEISQTEQKNILYQTIESAYRNAMAASKTYIASRKQVESLEETFRAVENQYNNGAANYTDYQVATNNLFQAQSDLSRAKFDFIFRQKILEFYLGKPLTF